MSEELNPVRCGCGGEAEIIKHTFHKASPSYGVECTNCHAESWQFYNTETEAVRHGTGLCQGTCRNVQKMHDAMSGLQRWNFRYAGIVMNRMSAMRMEHISTIARCAGRDWSGNE